MKSCLPGEVAPALSPSTLEAAGSLLSRVSSRQGKAVPSETLHKTEKKEEEERARGKPGLVAQPGVPS